MQTPYVSVLMPAYNSEKYVAEAIESILNQTFTDFEFIIINDGSKDSTADIVRKYAESDSRIKFIDNSKNQGLIAVLNQGLDLCSGKYIARMDSDDISLPLRFEKQIAYMDANPDVGILGTAGQNFGANSATNYSPEIVDAVELLRGVGFYHPSVMMRKSVLDKYNLRYDKDYFLVEDHELWARALKVTKLRNLYEVLLKYRVHNESVSNSNSRLQEENKVIVRNNILDTISDVPNVRQTLWKLAGAENHVPTPKRVMLFNFIPILNIFYKSENNIRISLFGFIPLLKVKNNKIYLFQFIRVGKIKENPSRRLEFRKFYNFCFKNNNLLSKLKSLGKFNYIINSGNMGDMFIATATLGFFDAHNLKYKVYDGTPADTIVYGGGGAWTADYEKHWCVWLDVFNSAKRVVILPSSFNNCQRLIDIMDERFTVFCREKKSYDYLKAANTKAEIILDHDMAFRINPGMLKKNINITTWDERNAVNVILKAIPTPRKVVCFMREDCESFGKYKSDLDLSAVLYGDTKSSRDYIDFCTSLVFMAVDCADVVVTDRLHIAIAAAVSGKEVYMLDNTYGKLSNVYNHSMIMNKRVHFCSEMPDIKKINPNHIPKSNFALLARI